MKVKALIFMLIFMFMFSTQTATTKKLESTGQVLNGGHSFSPIPGLVMIVHIKSIDNIPIIEKIDSFPGRYNERRKKLGEADSLSQGRKPRLVILNISEKVIYETEFDFPKLITIPPLPPEYFDPYTPAVIPIEEPEVTLVLPYFQDAAFLEVLSSDGILTSVMQIDQMISPFNLLPPEPPPMEMGKFHVLIMASNYDSSNMAKFISVANAIKQSSLTIEPFSTFSSKIDIHIYTNTEDLGCYSGCAGIDRLICCNSYNVISAAASSGYLYDEIIVIHNTDDYGGGGYRELGDAYKSNSYNTYAVAYGGTGISNWQEEVVLHEFGHSFGNLCDEYTYTTEGYSYKECVNCRASCSDWFSITSVCQAGCDAKSDYFRPEDSIMIYLTLPYYNQTSIKATYFPDGLEKRLKYFTQITSTKSDLLGTWPNQGVYYRNSDTGQWVKLGSPASKITTGDLDGDGTDDLIGIWPTQGGVWVRYSNNGTWVLLSSTADWIGSGDMNGDGQDDLLGTWTGQGVYYKDSATDIWIKIATPAIQITAGDIDGDGTDDLIGIWPAQGGVWVKYSSSGTWERLSSTADWIAAGKMRGTSSNSGTLALSAPVGGQAEGPGIVLEYEDLSSEGPGGWNFIYQEEENLVPLQKVTIRAPGPGEPGFRCREQENLVPQERLKKRRNNKDNTVDRGWNRISSPKALNVSDNTDRDRTGDFIGASSAYGNKLTGYEMEDTEVVLGPFGGIADEPRISSKYKDLLRYGPGGSLFICTVQKNIEVGSEIDEEKQSKMQPGPGEPGFKCIQQKNLMPQERLRSKKRK